MWDCRGYYYWGTSSLYRCWWVSLHSDDLQSVQPGAALTMNPHPSASSEHLNTNLNKDQRRRSSTTKPLTYSLCLAFMIKLTVPLPHLCGGIFGGSYAAVFSIGWAVLFYTYVCQCNLNNTLSEKPLSVFVCMKCIITPCYSFILSDIRSY